MKFIRIESMTIKYYLILTLIFGFVVNILNVPLKKEIANTLKTANLAVEVGANMEFSFIRMSRNSTPIKNGDRVLKRVIQL